MSVWKLKTSADPERKFAFSKQVNSFLYRLKATEKVDVAAALCPRIEETARTVENSVQQVCLYRVYRPSHILSFGAEMHKLFLSTF